MKIVNFEIFYLNFAKFNKKHLNQNRIFQLFLLQPYIVYFFQQFHIEIYY